MSEPTENQLSQKTDNVEQIRSMLFGEQLKEYESEFASYDQRFDKLDLELANFRDEMSDRLNNLQNSLTLELNSAMNGIDQKFKYLNLTSQDEIGKLKQEIKNTTQKLATLMDTVNTGFTQKNNALKEELSQTRTKLNSEVQELINEAQTEIGTSYLEVTDTKLSRLTLAETLFELCLKTKQPGFQETQQIQANIIE